MVVRASRMEVPAARFDKGGGGKVQEMILGSMEVLSGEVLGEAMGFPWWVLRRRGWRCSGVRDAGAAAAARRHRALYVAEI